MAWWIELRCDAHEMTNWDKPSCWNDCEDGCIGGLSGANQSAAAAMRSYLKKQAKNRGWKFRKGDSICPACLQFRREID